MKTVLSMKPKRATGYGVNWLVGAMVGLLTASTVVAQQTPARQPAADEQDLRGSGKVITRELPLADFTTIEVTRSFQLEITRADAFRVAINAEDNVLPRIQAVKDGSKLRISLNARSFWVSALKVSIAMPALEGVSLTRGSRATLKGFKSGKTFQARLDMSSALEGEIEAEKVAIDAAGGCSVRLKGSAREARISASQGCLLFLSDLVLERATVTLKNESKAAVRVTENLQYDLDSACRLEFPVMPAHTRGKTSGDSQALTSATPGEGWTKAKQGSSHHQHGGSPQGGGAAGSVAIPVGKAVPDFSLRDLDGKTLKFSDLRKDARQAGKSVLVLTIWCSTCASCRRVEHALDKLARDYQGKAVVAALDVNAGETPERVRAFAKEAGLTLPILLNPDGRAADLFGTEVTTTTVVIDADGVLRYCGRFRDGDQRAYAEDALKAVLAGKEVAIKATPHDG